MVWRRWLMRPKTAARQSEDGAPRGTWEPPSGLSRASCSRPVVGGCPFSSFGCPAGVRLQAP
eukprot:4098030-Alexandrium_andersonii.AAC.1